MSLLMHEQTDLPDFRQYKLNRVRRKPRGNVPPSRGLSGIPVAVDHYTGNPDVDVFYNDKLGDCVAADMCHYVNQLAWLQGDTGPATDADALSFYTLISQYPTADTGADVEDAMTAMAAEGILGYRIDGWEQIALSSIKPAIALFYGAHLSWNLPESAIQQSNAGQPWVPVPGSPLAGGHETYGVGYDQSYLYVDTWGFVQRVAWSFVAKYCVFSAVTADQALLTISGQTASALDTYWAQLTGSVRQPFTKPFVH